MTNLVELPLLRLNRGLIAQVAGLLAAGATVGIVVNEMSWAWRKPETVFYPRQTAELVNPKINRPKLEEIYRWLGVTRQWCPSS